MFKGHTRNSCQNILIVRIVKEILIKIIRMRFQIYLTCISNLLYLLFLPTIFSQDQCVQKVINDEKYCMTKIVHVCHFLIFESSCMTSSKKHPYLFSRPNLKFISLVFWLKKSETLIMITFLQSFFICTNIFCTKYTQFNS